MRKLLFALSFVGMLMTQSLAYASTILNTTLQETEQQEKTVSDETLEEEAPVVEETVFERKKRKRLLPKLLSLKNLRKDLSKVAPDLWGLF